MVDAAVWTVELLWVGFERKLSSIPMKENITTVTYQLDLNMSVKAHDVLGLLLEYLNMIRNKPKILKIHIYSHM